MNACYVVIPGAAKGKRIGIVRFKESGYYPTDYDVLDETQADCVLHVERLNKSLGVSPKIAEAMFAGSMFGWNVPAAKPAVDLYAVKEFPQHQRAQKETA